MEDKRFTDTQLEKIYVFNQMDSEEDIDKNLMEFFKELVNRRRNDIHEGGLQACAIIMPEKSAMKVTEQDGTTPHGYTYLNLIKHLNGDHQYYTRAGAQNFVLSQKESREKNESGIEIRIVDSANKIMLAINSKIKTLSQHQIDMLNKILLNCKIIKDSNIYNIFEVGCFVAECKVDIADLTDEQYENIINGINSLQKSSTIKR